MGAFQGYVPDTFGFLSELAFNNSRDWFEANKDRYQRVIVEPSLALITDLDPVIRQVSPHFRGVAKKVGGSLMRIYRDTRFSRDKTPYKTNIGIQLRHVLAGDVHTPGFYLHLATDECFMGAGTWHPEAPDLKRIRQRMADKPAEYTAAVQAATAGTGLTVYGESLKRLPKGFAADHPLAEELKRIDFLVTANLDHSLYLKPALVDELAQRFQAASPYMAFLCRALDVNY